MNKNNRKIRKEISAEAIDGQPETAFEMINKYGTYEIQPTADTDNEFPKIAQGLPKENQNNQNN